MTVFSGKWRKPRENLRGPSDSSEAWDISENTTETVFWREKITWRSFFSTIRVPPWAIVTPFCYRHYYFVVRHTIGYLGRGNVVSRRVPFFLPVPFGLSPPDNVRNTYLNASLSAVFCFPFKTIDRRTLCSCQNRDARHVENRLNRVFTVCVRARAGHKRRFMKKHAEYCRWPTSFGRFLRAIRLGLVQWSRTM